MKVKKLLTIVLAVTLMAGVTQATVLLHYDFSDGSGVTVTDLSGQGNHGTLGNFADTSAGAGQFGVSEGWVTGGGLSTLDDSVRSYVSTPLGLNEVPGDWTIEYQANADGPSGWTPVVACNQINWDEGEAFFFGLDESLSGNELLIPDGGGGTIGSHPYSLPGDQSDPSVYHIAAVYDSATHVVEIFVDGASVGTSTRTGTNFGGATCNFRIANTNWGWTSTEQWDGIIFGVAISDTKLVPANFVLLNPCTNIPPEVAIVPPADTQIGEPVQLLANVTDDGKPYVEGCDPEDPDSGTPYGLSYQWSQVSGPDIVTFLPTADVEDPCVLFPEAGVYQLKLRVWDGPIGPGEDDGKETQARMTAWVEISQEAAPAIIFETDMHSDYDDAGALATLHALADLGEVSILAVMHNTGHQYSVGTIDAVNTYYGRGDIPIGSYKGGSMPGSSGYPREIALNFPNDMVEKSNAPDAVQLYRRLLTAQPDNSVTIVSVGFLVNMRDLLVSVPDDISSLNGTDMVAQKIKLAVIMGGQYPSGLEYNFSVMADATKYVVENWPTPMVFSGFEIGSPIKTGSLLEFTPTENPVREIYRIRTGGTFEPHNSWDQTAILYSVRGLADYWNSEDTGYNKVFTNGSNQWYSTPDLDQEYLIELRSPSQMAQVIDGLMAQPPFVRDRMAAQWKLNATGGSTAFDDTGNGNTLTLYNMNDSDWVEGHQGNALELDGDDDYLSLNSGTRLNLTRNFTICAWIHPDNISALQGIVTKLAGTNDKQYALSVSNSGMLQFDYEVGDNDYVLNSGVLTTEKWQHVGVMVDDALNIKLYIDAVEVGSGTASVETAALDSHPMTIGRWSGSYNNNYFDGLIDQVVIFDRALSAEKIWQLAARGDGSFSRPCGGAEIADTIKLDGDVNHDCVVSFEDLALQSQDWLESGFLAGDIYHDKSVDLTDYDGLAGDWMTKVVPDAPINLTAAFNQNTGYVELDWDDSPPQGNLVGYNVYRSTTSGSGYEKLNDSFLTVSEFEDKNVNVGTDYYYVVTMTNTALFESGYSVQVAITPM